MSNTIFLSHQQIKDMNLNIQLACDNLQLVERIQINKQANPTEWLECLAVCYISKKLYNTGLFNFRNQYKENGTFLSYEAMANQLKSDINFKRLPAKVSQQTLKLLSQNIKSFFALKQSEKLTDNQKQKLNLPHYYKKGQLAPVIYTNQAISKTAFNKQGLIQLSQTNISLKSNTIKDFSQINCIRIIPSNDLKNQMASKKNQQIIEANFELFKKDETNFDILAKLESNYLAKFYDEDFVIEIVYTPEISQKRLANQSIKLIEEKINILVKNKKAKEEQTLKEKIVHNLEGNLDNFASIDINLNNLTVVTKNESFLFSLKPLKSKNHFWNKKCAIIQSKIDNLENEIEYLNSDVYQAYLQFTIDYHHTFLTEDSLKDFVKQKLAEKDNKITQNKHLIRKLKQQRRKATKYRNGYVDNFTHQLSKQIISKLNLLEVDNLIVGKNINFKKGINLGGKTNQQFVNIPFNSIIDKLSYKARLNGMNFMTVEESYTSKTSFFDKEKLFSFKYKPSEKVLKEELQGKRFERSLFKTRKGHVIHADINGAYNIARKVIGESIYFMVNMTAIMGSSPKIVKVKLN